MSTKETDTTEQHEKEPTVSEPAPAPPSKPAKPSKAPRKPSSAIAWLALLLIIVLAGGLVWVLQEAQRREEVLQGRLAGLEAVAAQKQQNLEAVEQRLRDEVKSGLGELETAVGGETFRLNTGLETLEAQLTAQAEELARFSASDRDSWLMAEAEYLLRLANQRMIMAGDTVAAQALLSSADDVLRELDATSLHTVRAAVAADLAAVRAVPVIDVQGIYLRLAAQIDRAGKLVIFQMPRLEAQPAPPAAENWRDRLRQGYEAALRKLSDYIIIRRREVPMQTLMDPQWEGLVRQNLRMLLEQAQVALLSGNQTLYSESLARAQHWVAEFLETDEASARAISRELTELQSLDVVVPLPEISRSLQALDIAIEQRLQQGGGE